MKQLTLASLLCNAGLSSALVQTADHANAASLQLKFVHADQTTKWTPNALELQEAETILMHSRSPILRAAADYCRARVGHHESCVINMVNEAMKAWPSSTEDGDGRSALPDALWVLAYRTGSPAAFRAIASLWMDGAPGEMLAGIRVRCFLEVPRPLAAAWTRLDPAKQRSFVENLATGCEDNSVLRAAIGTSSKSEVNSIRTLSRSVLRRLGP